jgi:DNA-binding MarR family transcriptional regulator
MVPDQPSTPGLDEDVSAIRDAVMEMGRRMSHPEARARLAAMAGIEMDKVGEVILTVLHQCGTEVRLSDVAHRLGVELSSVSRKVQKMEEAGLLDRNENPADKRSSQIFLTDHGKEVLEKIQQARWQMIKQALSQWSDADRHQFTDLLTRFLRDIAGQNEQVMSCADTSTTQNEECE